MPEKTFRSFIAVSLPGNVAGFLKDIQKQIKKSGIRASWSNPGTLHLTVRFLGEVSPESQPDIVRCVEACAGQFVPFALSAGGVGVFPSVKRARVIWSGLKGETDRLEKIHAVLEKELAQVGIAPSRQRFAPHLTLGRFKKPPDSGRLIKIMQDLKDLSSERFTVDRLHLFKSELLPSGAVHTKIFTAELSA